MNIIRNGMEAILDAGLTLNQISVCKSYHNGCDIKETCDANTQMLAVQSDSLVPTRHIDKHSQCHLAYVAIVPGHLKPQ